MGLTTKISPFAPANPPQALPVDGVELAAIEAGIKYKGRNDLLLVRLAEGSTCAGVLTQSKTRSAPVEWCAANLRNGNARALIVNSGNSNAFTGSKGVDTVNATANAVADALSCQAADVYIASTGVIGEPLPAERITAPLPGLAASLSEDAAAWQGAAQAIMTTDTFPKVASAHVEGIGDGRSATITGIAKGAGMIAPDMATMLSFIFTDLAISPGLLREAVKDAADLTFNAITIDGDTSTSDTVLVFATGKAAQRGDAAPITDPGDPAWQAFRLSLEKIMHELAQQIVCDGEGLTKHVTIRVSGAETDAAARAIGFSIANSPLVKTAIAGEDPNWGRIVMAIGKSGEAADRDRLSITLGPHRMATDGERASDHDEQAAARYMKNDRIEIEADVGVGTGKATVWTCDLTHDYISINADYRS